MDTMQQLVEAMNKSNISFHNKIAILAALNFTQDVLKGMHGEENKKLATSQIGTAFVAKINEWIMETK